MANVSLSKYTEFKDKKFLVVDDFPEFRTAIKRMVEAFGGEDVDTASNGEDAITKIKSKQYDIILCDYNLGECKDGQQVLEEGKYKGAINESQAFILLTAENTAEMVMGALEYEPDSYLVKPFTKEMVHDRVVKVAKKKQALREVYKNVEGKNPEVAIKLCDEMIAKGGKLILNCLKIKGKLLLKLERYDDAVKLYQPLLETKKLPWILMGLGQAYFYLKDYEKALEQFEGIIELSEVNVEGYDWIAKTQIALGRDDEAQTTLEKAVQLSSKAILRQQRLGDLAYKHEDIETAEKAYKAAVGLGKYSCYRRQEDYIRYGQILISKASTSDHGRISLRAGNDAVVVLEALCNLYRNDKKIQLEGTTLLCHAMLAVSRKDKARVLAKKCLNWVEKEHVEATPDVLLKLGEALIAVDEKEPGEALVKKYSHDDKKSADGK